MGSLLVFVCDQYRVLHANSIAVSVQYVVNNIVVLNMLLDMSLHVRVRQYRPICPCC